MRRPLISLAVVLGVWLLAPGERAFAQVSFNDPFALYYGYYLPHQAAVAAQATPMDTLNANAAARQFQAATDRAGLYDPISPFGEDEDPTRPYGRSSMRERIARAPGFATGLVGGGTGVQRGYSASATLGPAAMFYHRTARYYPTMRVGHGPNRNIAVTKSARGAAGMPSMPGPR